jgi:hypothetical protein
MALFGWLLGLIYGSDEPLLTEIVSGALVGLLGLRPVKVGSGSCWAASWASCSRP